MSAGHSKRQTFLLGLVAQNCFMYLCVAAFGTTATPTSTVFVTATPTPTNPPGMCCGEPSTCGGLPFRDCLSQASNDQCRWGDPCSALPPICNEVSSSVTISSPSVQPQAPRVGDAVSVRFDVSYRAYRVDSYNLEGAIPFLRVDQQVGTMFELTAVQAGRASIRLDVHYSTERRCEDGDGNVYFEGGPARIESSVEYVIEIAAAPTPTATSTPSPLPVPPGDDDSGGCQLGTASGGNAWWLHFPTAIALLVGIRRARRRGRPISSSPRSAGMTD